VTPARVALIVLLVAGAYFVAAPWLGCVLLVPIWRIDPPMVGVCTFGGPGPASARYGLPGFNFPYWGYLVVGVIYLAAAIFVARWRRPL
jgi:hypothetical protein